ncbi:MAG: dTDP-4-dehydrorhamnose reductase [Leptospiraceae bacterium]|nr:dTDP-4-dehydrorhamnose reductase [Leptospiraceae bacterium]
MALRVVITGGGGQLASCLKKCQPQGVNAHYFARNELDITDEAALGQKIKDLRPHWVINTAAYTKVDAAEKEPEAADAINHRAVAALAQICRSAGIRLLHISTDFIFHGNFNRPIAEDQPPLPRGVYAESKFAGERAVLASGVEGAIVRTAWLYSEFGHNFMKTMLRLAQERPQLSVVADQSGSPTYAGDLAEALWHMLKQRSEQPCPMQVWHFSNYGVTSWYDFACAILELAGSQTPVFPILTHEYPLPTPRPAFSALWPRRFAQEFSFSIRHWRAALVSAVAAYQNLREEQKP